MDAESLAARLGAATATVLVVLVFVPYFLASSADVGVYYGVTPVGPQLVAVFAVAAAIAFLAAGRGRADPATVAGVALVVGIVTAVFAVWWAASAASAAGGFTDLAAFEYHRWLVAAAAVALAGVAAWFSWLVLAE